MNYMKQVAEMLGVELGETFRIEGDEADYWLEKSNGLNWIERDVHDTDETVLAELLIGKKTIVKKSWKPKDGETYFYVKPDGNITFGIFGYYCVTDITLLAFGNCFKTREEAEAHKDEILAKIQEVLNG